MGLTHTSQEEKNLTDSEETPPQSVVHCPSLQIIVIHTAERSQWAAVLRLSQLLEMRWVES